MTREYLTQGFQFYRIAREQCSEIFTNCAEQEFDRIALHGLTDLAEIAVLCARDHGVELAGIVDPSSQLEIYSGIPVSTEIPQPNSFDAFIITDLGNPQWEYDNLVERFGPDRVYAPGILRVSMEPSPLLRESDHD